jgi:D-threo-aldose 1-dehydrogenase
MTSTTDAAGGWRALAELKAAGEIAAVGVGINLAGLIPRFLQRWPIDFFLVAMPYTLLEQENLDELEMCAAQGVAIVIGAPYASGILARGPGPGAFYRYAPAEPPIIAKAEAIAVVCQRHRVPLGAAALQFPLAHRSVVSVIPGPLAIEEVHSNLVWMRCDIPDALWDELKAERLICAEAPTPRLPGST